MTLTYQEVLVAANNFIQDTVTADAKINGPAGDVTDRHGVITPNLEKILDNIPFGVADADYFGRYYLGPKASDPTLDNQDNPLETGAIYFNETDGLLKFYANSVWNTIAEEQDFINKTLNIKSTTKTSSHILTVDDIHTMLKVDSLSDSLISIPLDPTDAFPLGCQISVMQVGSGSVEIVGETGVTVHSAFGTRIPARWGVAVIHKHLQNEWVVTS